MSDQHIFKIFQLAEWADFRAKGTFQGSLHDKRDGFIHLSTESQLQGTLDKHYQGTDDVIIAEICAASLGQGLKYEISRGGAHFPHLYDSLVSSAVRRYWPVSANAALSAGGERRYAVSEILKAPAQEQGLPKI